MFFKKKAPTWCFETDANDNNGNGSVFLDIYDRVYDIELHCGNSTKTEVQLSLDFERYCFENIHGLTKVHCKYEMGVFMGVRLYFKDDASLSWFMLRWV